MSPITTHILDTTRGRPAVGVEVELQEKSGAGWKSLGADTSDANGRCNSLMAEQKLKRGAYRLLFDVGRYFQEQEREAFYSEITVTFEVHHPETHYHVPLLLSPFGYTTYRGS